MKSVNKILCYITLIMATMIANAGASGIIRVYATVTGTDDTIGVSEQYLVYGVRTPVFIPPYTLYFTVNPYGSSLYSTAIDCYELGQDDDGYHYLNDIPLGKWQTIDTLKSKDAKFDYFYMIGQETAKSLDYMPAESLSCYISSHFTGWLPPKSLAEYKWEMRKNYLEDIYDFYRKAHKISKALKMNLYIFPDRNNSPFINNLTGTGYDVASDAMYAVQNENYDSVLPQNAALYTVYKYWGYGPRFIAVGYSRYFLFDTYRARTLVQDMTANQLQNALCDEYPAYTERADILSGAFVRFLIDRYGFSQLRKLYGKSYPGYMAFQDIYKKSITEIIKEFLVYEKTLRLQEQDVAFISDLYRGQLWFDKALEYDFWLGSQLANHECHLKRLAETYFQVGDYEKSKGAYATLLDLNQDNNEEKYLLGMSLLCLGKTEEAIRIFERITKSYPNAAKMLAEIYLRRYEYDKAKEALSNVSESSDGWTMALKANLELVMGNKENAQALLTKAVDLGNSVIADLPGEAKGYLAAAFGLMLKGEYDEAQAKFQVALLVDMRPLYQGLATLGLGQLYDMKGDHGKAMDYYRKMLKIKCGAYLKQLAAEYIREPYKL